jgi:hypothetical protein
MIRVTVELISAIDKSRNEILGVCEIANDGTGTDSVGNYNVALTQRGGKKLWRTGRVVGFHRKKFLAWDLLLLALGFCLGPERIRSYPNADQV